MDNERDPNRQNEETADVNDEAIKGRADGEDEFEDTDDIDEDEDAEDTDSKLDASE
jgi:hypothetical protein